MSTWQLLFLSGSVSSSKIPESFKLCPPPRSLLVAHTHILKDKWLLFIRVEANLQKHAAFHPASLQGPLCAGSKEAQRFIAEFQHCHSWTVGNDKVRPTGPWIYNVMNASNITRWVLLASFKLWRVQTLSKKGSLPSYAMERGSGHLGSSSTLPTFKWQAETKKVTRTGKLRFFLKPSDRFCWPPHRIEVSPIYLPPVCLCTSSAVHHRDPVTQAPSSASGTAGGTTVQDFPYSFPLMLLLLNYPLLITDLKNFFFFLWEKTAFLLKNLKGREINQTLLINKCIIKKSKS